MASICTQNFKSKFASLKIESLILSIPLNTIENDSNGECFKRNLCENMFIPSFSIVRKHNCVQLLCQERL